MLKRTNEDWLSSLNSNGRREAAISNLRSIISADLPYALSKWLDRNDPRFDALAEEVTQETILRVLDKLDTFEGRSQFTTWVHTIAVRIAITELRRAKWKELSLEKMIEKKESEDSPLELSDNSPSVEDSVEQNEMMAMVTQMMEQELTEKQRLALTAVAVHGLPLEEVAIRLGTNRNALYKLLHDARIKLKSHLELQGLTSK